MKKFTNALLFIVAAIIGTVITRLYLYPYADALIDQILYRATIENHSQEYAKTWYRGSEYEVVVAYKSHRFNKPLGEFVYVIRHTQSNSQELFEPCTEDQIMGTGNLIMVSYRPSYKSLKLIDSTYITPSCYADVVVIKNRFTE